MVWLGFAKSHTYPVWGMTMLRQIRSTGPMRAPCFRGLSPGHFMLNVYWVLFLCVPDTLAAPCVTCYGFQPGCTFETNGKCPMADIPVANLAITAKAGVGGALVLQNAVSNKYNRTRLARRRARLCGKDVLLLVNAGYSSGRRTGRRARLASPCRCARPACRGLRSRIHSFQLYEKGCN